MRVLLFAVDGDSEVAVVFCFRLVLYHVEGVGCCGEKIHAHYCHNEVVLAVFLYKVGAPSDGVTTRSELETLVGDFAGVFDFVFGLVG